MPFDHDAVPHWIKDPAELELRIAQHPGRIGLDTEFIRERTYWQQLALVQVSLGDGDDDILLVAPPAPGITTALRPLLTDTAALTAMPRTRDDLFPRMQPCRAASPPRSATPAAPPLARVTADTPTQRP